MTLTLGLNMSSPMNDLDLEMSSPTPDLGSEMSSPMTDVQGAKERIKKMIVELAKDLDNDATGLGYDELIPTTGLLDSASLMVLIVWYEKEFAVSTDKEEPTLDNFGTINLMVDYLGRHG
jgi:acyl carrier protein